MQDDAENPRSAAALAPASNAALDAPAPTTTRTIALAAGRALDITTQGAEEHLRVRAADGQIELSIRLTADGPVLSLAAISLEIEAQKRISLKSETLAIRTSGDATIDVGGALHERTRGNSIRDVGKASIERAREVSVEASPGGVVIKANDDVSITGERVRLNSDDPPMPLTWEEHRERQARRLATPNERPVELVFPELSTRTTGE